MHIDSEIIKLICFRKDVQHEHCCKCERYSVEKWH